ncbi:transglycosylase domain-containing protein [Fusobacterium nucleatum]|uniref:Penicillin-binding protein, 1A family n=1 Tax=Fusobacterium nucleatum TaxID=851 RepID=A0A133P5X2_FUSNU|nr:transglycosylase domain-containing protein [Fusobacterium nucleatum]KXA23969.1 penicillin-binding protein, 1A family [Fusobacterium nucleatum]MCL4576439.1 penicillin-binding protein [Fusobacterium nucleatum YWH7056]MCL4582834.1 penicillin-binding protein [Fusobacterium nucleatum YWH7054]MCL4591793.1 penicillin-binding protein [Fusobacterium nucleatum YWH7053]
MKKILILLLKIIGALFIVGVIGVFAIIIKYRLELPNMQSMVEDYKPQMATTIYDKNNKVVDTLSVEAREVVKLEDVSPYIKDAFLSIEDKQFYSHHGLNFKGIARAVITTFLKGRATQGGSSITQQLAKNAFLTPEKTFSRKVKEAILTYQIERTYTKDEILERYFNEIYYGSGSYGIKNAAEQYFKKDVKDLNIAESALLAGIPNRPTKYDPNRNLENALHRQRIILKEMYDDGKITKEQYDEALAYKFELENEDNVKNVPANTSIIYNKRTKNTYKNPELTTIVEDYLAEIYDEEQIYTSGLKIYTTIDLDYQKVAKETFNSYPYFKNKEINGAMITLDPFTGGIVSIVGGKNFKAGNFDRATMARRQLGSSFKPFVYLEALENGFETYSVVVNDFVAFGKWAPKNFDGRYSYNSTLVNSLNLSLNIPAVKLLDAITVDKFKEGIGDNIKLTSEVKDLTAALGSVDSTPVNVAANFSIFVNGGYIVKPNIIREIRDNQDILIYVADIEKTKVFDSVDVSAITAMLKTVVSNGTASRARVVDKTGRPIQQGGKTGTTNEHRTAWFVGITPEYVTVCYIGRDDNKPMYGKMTGGSAVAPMWAKYYQTLINKGLYTPGKFEFLENYLETGDLVKQNIDIYSGLLDGPNSKEFTVRKGRLQVESAAKYKNGIASVFGLDGNVSNGAGIDVSDGMIIDTGNGEGTEGSTGEGNVETPNTSTPSTSTGENAPPVQQNNSNNKDGDSLTNRLLGD